MQAFAAAHGLPFLEASALKGKNIEECFRKVLTQIHKTTSSRMLSKDNEEPEDRFQGQKIDLQAQADGPDKRGWASSCCNICSRLFGGSSEAQKPKSI